MLTRLVDLGLPRRQRLHGDRRDVLLHLTDMGSEQTWREDERVKEADARLLEGVSEAELGVFTLLTSKITANYGALGESR